MSATGIPGSPDEKRLDQVERYRLVLIVAPPGSGKTALLRSWAQRISREDGVTLAWVSLTQSDNRPEWFLADLDRAFEPEHPADWAPDPREGSPTSPIAPRPHPQPDLEAELIDRLNRLADRPGEIYLVLDGYDVIVFPGIHAGISLLLDYLPPHLHLLITCRSEPPLPLARLRVRRQLLELGAEAL